jgi:hypothetical protein
MNNHTFITSSLPLAAFLVAGHSLEFRGIELTNPKSAVFVFDDPQRRGRELENSFSCGAMISAIEFHTQLRSLRRALNDHISTASSGANGQIKFKGNQNHVRSFASQR